MVCFTGVQSEGKRPISQGIGVVDARELFERMDAVFRGPADKGLIMESEGKLRDANGELTNEWGVVTKFSFGKNADGICWIRLEDAQNERARVVFKYEGSRWHKYRTPDGEALDLSELSQGLALGTVRYLRDAIMPHIASITSSERRAQDEAFKERRNGGGGEVQKKAQPTALKPSASGFDDLDEDIMF